MEHLHKSPPLWSWKLRNDKRGHLLKSRAEQIPLNRFHWLSLSLSLCYACFISPDVKPLEEEMRWYPLMLELNWISPFPDPSPRCAAEQFASVIARVIVWRFVDTR